MSGHQTGSTKDSTQTSQPKPITKPTPQPNQPRRPPNKPQGNAIPIEPSGTETGHGEVNQPSSGPRVIKTGATINPSTGVDKHGGEADPLAVPSKPTTNNPSSGGNVKRPTPNFNKPKKDGDTETPKIPKKVHHPDYEEVDLSTVPEMAWEAPKPKPKPDSGSGDQKPQSLPDGPLSKTDRINKILRKQPIKTAELEDELERVDRHLKTAKDQRKAAGPIALQSDKQKAVEAIAAAVANERWPGDAYKFTQILCVQASVALCEVSRGGVSELITVPIVVAETPKAAPTAAMVVGRLRATYFAQSKDLNDAGMQEMHKWTGVKDDKKEEKKEEGKTENKDKESTSTATGPRKDNAKTKEELREEQQKRDVPKGSKDEYRIYRTIVAQRLRDGYPSINGPDEAPLAPSRGT